MDLGIEQQGWQRANAQLEKLVRRRICDQVGRPIWYQVGELVRSHVDNQVSNKLRVQIKVRVWYQVWDQITEDSDVSTDRDRKSVV